MCEVVGVVDAVVLWLDVAVLVGDVVGVAVRVVVIVLVAVDVPVVVGLDVAELVAVDVVVAVVVAVVVVSVVDGDDVAVVVAVDVGVVRSHVLNVPSMYAASAAFSMAAASLHLPSAIETMFRSCNAVSNTATPRANSSSISLSWPLARAPFEESAKSRVTSSAGEATHSSSAGSPAVVSAQTARRSFTSAACTLQTAPTSTPKFPKAVQTNWGCSAVVVGLVVAVVVRVEVPEDVIVLVGVDDGVVVVVGLLVMLLVTVEVPVVVRELVPVVDNVLVAVVDCVVEGVVLWLDVPVLEPDVVAVEVAVDVRVDVGVVRSQCANVPSMNDSRARFNVSTAASHLLAGSTAMYPPMCRSTANPPSPRVYSSNMASSSCDAAPSSDASANTCVPSFSLHVSNGGLPSASAPASLL